ncbi:MULTISPECIES: Nif3-like dinuclear metal center hexameric protein [Clostridium]|uniref:GTP cyclohydrolase 1 type 2 homolog n=1 Tax=Clostridium aquiflavi TaxID=3073603 RepID=A0ABU1EF81_9CLOT|nr:MULTISPECIES: Nif3-like dinuclear metal center hexameric protein [unclassified Clostridium]MDR5586629.1 Nif3-like dinuclear metal center hexameric protein [Clostridium sp. 5N-1]NFG60547.1 Nif3-like dinuclear metal center hexameric protein [Clostridium botulinum]NFQ09810.1 Nif3-like dinuclear metal center hexameric protein [Clostridium botulinum]
MVLVKDIANIIEEKAPKFLKEDFDNVGLMVGDENKEVKTVLLALDCTKKVIKEAIDNKVDLIITHHPLIFKKPKSIINGDLLGDKVIDLIKNDISLYSCHTNLDSAKDGINDALLELLDLKYSKIIESSNIKGFEECGLGRIVELEKNINIEEIVSNLKEKLNIKNMRVVKGDNHINKLAIINGSGQDFFYMCKELGVNCIITGDTTYHFASDFKEYGINIIDAGHFSTEWLAFIKSLEFLKNKFKEIKFIVSEKCEDPYDFI